MAETTGIKFGTTNIAPETLLNVIRNEQSTQYQKAIPVASAKSINATISAITSNPNHYDSFYTSLTKFARQAFINVHYVDPIDEVFNQGKLEWGSSVENTIIGLVPERVFDYDAAQEVFEIVKPDMSSLYSEVNRRSKYKITIAKQQSRMVLINNGLDSLVDKVFGTLQTSMERDNTKYSKALLHKAYLDRDMVFKTVKLDENGDVDYTALAIQLRETFENIKWLDTGATQRYNVFGAEINTPAEDVLTILSNKAVANMDVKVMASAFNVDSANLFGEKLHLNHFEDDNIVAMMLDKNFIQIYDYLQSSTSFDNPETLTDTNFLHVWKLYTIVKFYNAIVFVKYLDADFSEFSRLIPTTAGKNVIAVGSKTEAIDFMPLYPVELQAALKAHPGSRASVKISMELNTKDKTAGPTVTLYQGDKVIADGITNGTTKTAEFTDPNLNDVRLVFTPKPAKGATDGMGVDYQGEVQFEVTILNGTSDSQKVVIQPSKFSTIVATHSTDKGY